MSKRGSHGCITHKRIREVIPVAAVKTKLGGRRSEGFGHVRKRGRSHMACQAIELGVEETRAR